jgi:SPFH domain / Band 7 family
VKAATAHYDAADLIVQRDEVALEIGALLRTALQSYRIIIDAVNITDFQ